MSQAKIADVIQNLPGFIIGEFHVTFHKPGDTHDAACRGVCVPMLMHDGTTQLYVSIPGIDVMVPLSEQGAEYLANALLSPGTMPKNFVRQVRP